MIHYIQVIKNCKKMNFLYNFEAMKINKCYYYPIGALTSKPYSFRGRSWELTSIESLDFFDSYGSKIKVDIRGLEILRILPWVDSSTNEDWITDKIRFGFDGLKYQRLDKPFLRVNGVLTPVSWRRALNYVRDFYERGRTKVFGISGKFCDIESLLYFKKVINLMGSSHVISNVSFNNFINVDFINYFIFDSKIKEFDNSSIDFILLLNCYPRLESPLLNIRLRRFYMSKWKKYGRLFIANFGFLFNSTYPVLNFGINIESFLKLMEGRHSFSKRFFKSKQSLILIGESFLQRVDGGSIVQLVKWFNSQSNFFSLAFYKNLKFNFLWGDLGALSSFYNGFFLGDNTNNFKENKINKDKLEKKIYYVFDNDEILLNKKNNDLVVYHGHHGDKLIENADIVFPSVAPLEKNSLFINLEGMLQKMSFVSNSLGLAQNDRKIFLALADTLKFSKDKDSFVNPFLLKSIFNSNKKIFDFHQLVFLDKEKNLMNFYVNISCFYIEDYYLSDSISRSSQALAIASKRFKTRRFSNFF